MPQNNETAFSPADDPQGATTGDPRRQPRFGRNEDAHGQQQRQDHDEGSQDGGEDQQEDQQQDGQGGDDQGGDQAGGDKKNDAQQDGEQQDGDQKKKSKKPLIILGLVVVILGIASAIWTYVTRNDIGTDDAYTEGNAVTIAPKVSGYVVQLNIDDNSFVHKDDVMMLIDPRDYINARETAVANLQLAQAQLLSAKVNYDLAKVRYPAQLAQAEAQKSQSEASRFQADQEYKRQHSVNERATTQENIDTATAQQRSAAAQVTQSQAQIDIAKPIPVYLASVNASVKQAEAQVSQAQAQLDQADLNLSWTSVRAPQDGWVTRRNVQLGSYLQAGQSLFELVTRDVWIVANYKETQLDRMRLGQHVDISVDAYPNLKLTGHVETLQMGSGSRFSAFPAENATGNFVKIVQRLPVKIVLDNNNPPGGGKNDWPMLPIGLSVEPIVRLGTEPHPGQGALHMFEDFRGQPKALLNQTALTPATPPGTHP